MVVFTVVKGKYYLRKMGLELGNWITVMEKYTLLPKDKRQEKLIFYREISLGTKARFSRGKIPGQKFTR